MTLCNMIHTIGRLGPSKHVTLEEKVAFFLFILAQHLKIRNVKFNFYRSGQTVSRYVNDILKAVLRLQANLLSTPNPITEANTDPRWNCFQVNTLSTNLVTLHYFFDFLLFSILPKTKNHNYYNIYSTGLFRIVLEHLMAPILEFVCP